MPSLSDESYYDIDLLAHVAFINYTDNKKYKLINDNATLRMKNEDMQTKVFDPIVGRV